MTASSAPSSSSFTSGALAASNVGIWEYDVDRNWMIVDETVADLFGLSVQDVERGVPIERIRQAVHPDDRGLSGATLRRMIEHGGVFMVEYRTVPAPNVMRRVLCRGRYDVDAHGHVWHGSGIVMDVTDGGRSVEVEGRMLGIVMAAHVGETSVEQEEFDNRLLRQLPADILAALGQHLERVTLPKGFVVCKPDETIDYVYFPEGGLSSVIAVSPEGNQAEAGVYGRDGLGPVAVVLGATRSPQKVMVQIGWTANRIASHRLMDLMDRMPALRGLLTLYAQTFLVQTAFAAMSNALHTIETRLARWLLMCHDRSTVDTLPLTHDFLALMLAVRRPGVTVALHMLEGERLIRSGRGLVTIRDRAGLERVAADAYGKPEAEYRRLIGELEHGTGTRRP